MKRINPYRLWTGAYIPNWLLCRNEIGHGEKIVYARLSQYTEVTGYAQPTREVLAAEIGTSVRQLDRYLTQLATQNLIEIEQVGAKKPNKYWFLTHKWMQSPVPDGSPQETIQIELKSDYEHEFHTVFYPAYPRKLDRPTALLAFVRARKKGASLEEIMSGLALYLRLELEIKKTELQHLKHPTTFLNKESWANDYMTEIENAERNDPAYSKATKHREGTERLAAIAREELDRTEH